MTAPKDPGELPPRKFRNTLALRLTLWYAGIFTVSSFVAFLLFYLVVTSFMQGRIDQELLDRAGELSNLLESRGIEAVKQATVLEAQAAGLKKVFFRLLTPAGQTFASSSLSYWNDIGVREKFLRQLLAAGDPLLETVVTPDRRDRVRVLYVRIGPRVILQMGQSMEETSRFIEAFKRIFTVTMTLLIALAAGIGWFMARRAVSGVEAVTRTALEISGGRLDRRVPVKDRGDEIDRLAATFNQMLDRLQTLVQEIKEMSDNIAHDLKSPITIMRGLAEVTLTTGKSRSEYEALAAGIVEECDRLLGLIDTRLLISKTEAGVTGLNWETVDLARLSREAGELFRPLAEDKGITLHCEIPETFPFRGDNRLLQRMAANLLDNAIKYTPEGGSVELSLSSGPDQAVRLSIRDTGPGLSPEDLSRIFKRFYRGDHSRSQPGSGLGLSLARTIARAHGGDITVTSALNAGSTFTAVLPRSLPPANEPPV